MGGTLTGINAEEARRERGRTGPLLLLRKHEHRARRRGGSSL